MRTPGADRLWYIADAFRYGLSLEEVFNHCMVDPWFLAEIEDLINIEAEIRASGLRSIDAASLRQYKRKGFSDKRLAALLNTDEETVRGLRKQLGVHPVYNSVYVFQLRRFLRSPAHR